MKRTPHHNQALVPNQGDVTGGVLAVDGNMAESAKRDFTAGT